MITTIDSQGRIALGHEVQNQLGVRPGDDLVLEHRGDEWVIKAAAKTGLAWEGNVLVYRGESPQNFDIVGFIDALRDERDAELSGHPQ